MRELVTAMPVTEGETHRPHPNNQLPANATPSPARRAPSQAILSIRVGPCLSPGSIFAAASGPCADRRFRGSALLFFYPIHAPNVAMGTTSMPSLRR